MPPRAGLDKARVVQAAVELVNAEGVEALTISRLAARLGIQAPSLYNHIDGLRGLYRELALWDVRRLGERLGDAAIGKSGPQAVQAVAQAYRKYVKKNTGLYNAGLRQRRYREPGDAELERAEARVVEIALAVVASFGLSGEDGLHAVRGLRSLVHGFATLEVAGGFGLPLDLDESFNRLVDMFIRGMDKKEA